MTDNKPREKTFPGKKSPDLHQERKVDKNGGVLVLSKAEVSLHIPEGALDRPTSISIEIIDTVAQSNGMNKTRPFTPTVSCKPKGQKFNKHVELIVPHCVVFEDFSFYQANVRCIDGNISIVDGEKVAEETIYRVKERVCHIFTTHFSNFTVSISGAVKKRMGVMPFTDIQSENSLSCDVWFVNDLPSEYILLRQVEEAKGLSPFDISGKFILHNQRYDLEAEAKSAKDSANLFRNNKVTINTKLLHSTNRHCDKIQTTLSDTSAYPREYAIRVLREARTKPASILRKNDEQDTSKEIIVNELTECLDKLSECLLEWELEDVPKGQFFDDDTMQTLKRVAEEVESNRLKKNIGVISGSSASIAGGAMSIIGGALLLTPFTAIPGAVLLGSGIGLSVAGSSVSLGFSIDKTVRDKLRKDKIKDSLNDFVIIQKNLINSAANILEARSAIEKLKDINTTKLTSTEREGLQKLKNRITAHEAGRNVDFITLPEIFRQLNRESEEVIKYLQAVQKVTGTKLVTMEQNPLQTVVSHKEGLLSYETKEEKVVTFVDFARDYLKLDDVDLKDSVAMAAKQGFEGANAGLRVGAMAARVAVDANDDVASLGGNALKIANGFTSAGIALGAVGMVVDAGFLGYAIYDLVKDDKEKFTQGLLEVIELMKQMNCIDLRSKKKPSEWTAALPK